MPPKRYPRLIMHTSASVDGRVALTPGLPLMADARWPQTSGYGDVMARHKPGALIEGAGSFLASGQAPTWPEPASAVGLHRDFLPARAVARATRGWLAVTDSRGRVRWQFAQYPGAEFAGWHLLVLVSRHTPPGYLAFLREQDIPYLVRGDRQVDLPGALVALRSLGAGTVVATGGGRLQGALLRTGLADEIEVEVLPIAVGGEKVPAMMTAPDLAPGDEPVALTLLGADARAGGRVLLRYRVDKPGQG